MEEVNIPAAIHVEHLDKVRRIVVAFRLWADRQRRLLLIENIRILFNVRRCRRRASRGPVRKSQGIEYFAFTIRL
jgi:hypothetical protein